MNELEIEWAASRTHDCHNVRKGIRLLHRLMHAVNAQSDGWAYWHAPRKAAEKLIELLKTAGNLSHGTHDTIADADLRKAVAPIKRMVTTQSKKQKQYGNTFEFDVDAALEAAEPEPEPESQRSAIHWKLGDYLWHKDATTGMAYRFRRLLNEHDQCIAWISADVGDVEADRDANVLATAQELLAACQMMLRLVEGEHLFNSEAEVLRAAIAKATSDH